MKFLNRLEQRGNQLCKCSLGSVNMTQRGLVPGPTCYSPEAEGGGLFSAAVVAGVSFTTKSRAHKLRKLGPKGTENGRASILIQTEAVTKFVRESW